ncbi:TF2B [Hepatospora eriocheir]|uniref:Transcription initiation factor IIB n=1 Tax=Hepatospora eriocheir TaxID=1081669 RepID=A0A1X0QBU4_9MICR|nr:TF2B [Hepatospora eriocheir]
MNILSKKCPDCGETKDIIEDYKNGYNVCAKCGCVLKDRVIDEGIEWRNFSDGSKPNKSRVGSSENPFIENTQLDTMIATNAVGAYNLSKIQSKSYMKSGGKNYKSGMNLITAHCEQHNLSQAVQDRALYVFKIVEDKKLVKGKNVEGVIAACIYIACKQEGCPRTFKEISVVTSIPKREVGKCYKMIFRDVDGVKLFETADIIPRFCSELSLNGKIQSVASEIAKNVCNLEILTGRSPDSIAGAVILLVLHLFPEKLSAQRKIVNVANVTETTIKNTYRDLIPHLKDILPSEYYREGIEEFFIK